MPFPNPRCPSCHGTGEIEHIVHYTENGKPAVLFEYEPCPCGFRSQWVDQEDWANDRHR